ncbi:MAG: sterol desaturase family protein [Magnetospirillum sp.]|nr:sterol desaturase family protein [Magnetospirillum sp.]
MRDSIRLFDNPLLERLTKARPTTVVLVYAPVVAALLAISGPALGWAAAGWAALGLAAWTLFEYGMHRVAFHWPARSPWGRRLVFLMHGCHHADPGDPERAVMPPVASLPLAAACYGVAALALAAPLRDAAFAGFLFGYLHYDLTHWACHQAHMAGPLGRRLKRHHLRHHYAGADGNYGGGHSFWDWAFGSVLGPRRPS